MQKNVLVIGNGGREHALCWKLAQSPQVAKVYCAPGNGGTAQEPRVENIPISASNFPDLIAFARTQHIDLTVIGPDNPLADGIVDAFQAAGLRVFGPTQQGAKLESSKVFSKQFMKANNLPTARFGVFNTANDALTFCRTNDWARVIKVDGLALGKGVYVCEDLDECETALSEIFDTNRFGDSGAQVVVEERLYGPEISLMVLCDGKTMLPLSSSQDYKRRFEGNTGSNTGGMGAYSPVPHYSLYQKDVEREILKPLEKALLAADFEFKGLLYIGLMMHENKPYILEFNARFGDPETQCLLPRLENDLYDLFDACVQGSLAQHTLYWQDQSCVCVVLCADTYPQSGSKNVPIRLESPPPGVFIFHAGTAVIDNQLMTNGGRILNVVTLGETLDVASAKAYDVISQVQFDGMAYRQDIAKDVTVCLLT